MNGSASSSHFELSKRLLDHKRRGRDAVATIVERRAGAGGRQRDVRSTLCAKGTSRLCWKSTP